MKKILFIMLLVLIGCKSIVPTVLTETKQGEPVTMTKVQETASRTDIPADVAPRQVVAKVETKSGAKVWVVKKSPFKSPVVYQNQQAKDEGLTVAQPRDPWWKYPAIVAGILAILALLYFWRTITGWLGLIKKFLPVLAIVVVLAGLAYAASVTLSWNAPTTYTDGSPVALSDIGGYKIYYGHATRTYTSIVSVANPMTAIVTSTLSSLPTGTYYFAVTAYGTDGIESDYSNEISMYLSAGALSPPAKLVGQVKNVGVQ